MTIFGMFIAYGLGIFLVAFTVTFVYIRERKAMVEAGTWPGFWDLNKDL